ncbi:hypothetical protein HL667_01095 [Bradyrhizobium sp. 83012]|uniref:Uncharacterized protein n=1 Tax=Bradyrhizobium aeschynomenes TaxID=2734909 RepID=A0ABX2C5M7_9BRAD|nr:hypothetical protein [Bradyrhizobium aeschynomenes]NPU10094.1 hypothetical protein [Bradyrhizobium aeschynomenes]NPU63589.1 hypothetical protein [Bradyrhizobium aeschynomenes]NPV19408.1 hypothetical protein [Bradyrhizobium aeschynomenes]
MSEQQQIPTSPSENEPDILLDNPYAGPMLPEAFVEQIEEQSAADLARHAELEAELIESGADEVVAVEQQLETAEDETVSEIDEPAAPPLSSHSIHQIEHRLAEAARAIAAAQHAFNEAVGRTAAAMERKMAATQAAMLSRRPQVEPLPPPMEYASPTVETAEQAVAASIIATRQATGFTDRQLSAMAAAGRAIIAEAQEAAEQSVIAAERSIGAAMAASQPPIQRTAAAS